MLDREMLARHSRRLRARADAILGAVWYGRDRGVGYPDLGLSEAAASLGGRVACLGPVSGAVAASILGTLEPTRVAGAVDEAFGATSAAELLGRRLESSVEVLRAELGDPASQIERAVTLLRRGTDAAQTAGHPMFAGLARLPLPGESLGQLWRLCDMVREHRGDAHTNAWRAAGLDPVEINVLSEAWRSLPTGSVAKSQMGWRRGDVASACQRLSARRWLTSDAKLTDEGRTAREDIEFRTDIQQRSLVTAIGGDIEELCAILDPWARAMMLVAARNIETYDTVRASSRS
jgi:hypothetical protein